MFQDNDENGYSPEYYEEEEIERLETHINTYFGEFDSVFHEIISPDIHVDIAIIKPRPGHDYFTLITMGMGAHRMSVPQELDGQGLERAELLINLPPDWRFGDGQCISPGGSGEDADESCYWPIRWLKILARMPGDYETWLGWGHTVPTGDAVADTDFRCMLLINPGAFDEKSWSCEMPDGSCVNFYQVVPLYEEEMDYKVENDAETLLEQMTDEMLAVVDAERPNACLNCDPLRGVSFVRRIDDFRAWFLENEPRLADMVEHRDSYDQDEVVAFVSEGTNLLSRNVFFNLGGNFEFTFAVENREYLFYLYQRIVTAMKKLPDELRDKWTFYPWMPGNDGRFAIGIYGMTVSADEVSVGMFVTEDEAPDSVVLHVYSETLASLDENESYHAFRILLDNCIGEGLSYRYIDDVEMLDAPEEGMYPLSELKSRMSALFGEDGASLAFDPTDRYFSYSREVAEDEDEEFELRRDVFAGVGSYLPLINEYYEGSTDSWRKFQSFGAKPMFLCYGVNPAMEGRELVDERYELQEALENEVLGARGSGGETGIVLGGAMGEAYIYVDLLLYDEEAFLKRMHNVLDRYDYEFYLAEFRFGGSVTALFEMEN